MFLATGQFGEVEIGGSRHKLYLNLNTNMEFERTSGKHFVDWATEMPTQMQAAAPNGQPDQSDTRAVELYREAIAKLLLRNTAEFVAFLRAALQQYSSDGMEVQFPFTAARIGGLVDLAKWGEILPILLSGMGTARVRDEDLPAQARPSAGSGNGRPTEGGRTNGSGSIPTHGGPPSIPSGAEILDSLTLSSDVPRSGASASGGEASNVGGS